MRRFVVPLLALALFGAACTGAGSTGKTSSPSGVGDRAAFPSSSPVVPQSGPQNGVVGVVKKVLPAVVNVVSTTDQGQAEGTGFVVRSDGIIVTNFHVVEGATKVVVRTSATKPVTYPARVIGGDQQADVAVLDINATGLPTVPLGASAGLQLGQPVVAIGYALGLQGGPSVTDGIVSSLRHNVTVPDPGCQICPHQRRVYTDVVQTDAAINPGNSGGPLVNMAGQVVGINTAGVGAASAENIGFAIAIDAAKPIVFQAAEHPSAPVAFMGVGSADASDPQVQFQLNPPVSRGAVILTVVPNGPADRAGIRVGDVVVALDGRAIGGSAALGEAIRSHRPGDRVPVTVVHPDGARATVEITLGTNPVGLQQP